MLSGTLTPRDILTDNNFFTETRHVEAWGSLERVPFLFLEVNFFQTIQYSVESGVAVASLASRIFFWIFPSFHRAP